MGLRAAPLLVVLCAACAAHVVPPPVTAPSLAAPSLAAPSPAAQTAVAAPVICVDKEPRSLASDAERHQAHLLFHDGMEAINACNYADGIEKLKGARAVVPARDVTYNIARAYMEIWDRPTAIRYFRE